MRHLKASSLLPSSNVEFTCPLAGQYKFMYRGERNLWFLHTAHDTCTKTIISAVQMENEWGHLQFIQLLPLNLPPCCGFWRSQRAWTLITFITQYEKYPLSSRCTYASSTSSTSSSASGHHWSQIAPSSPLLHLRRLRKSRLDSVRSSAEIKHKRITMHDSERAVSVLKLKHVFMLFVCLLLLF